MLQSLPWTEPLALAAAIDEPYYALLYSGVHIEGESQISYLACNLKERVEGANFSQFAQKLSSDNSFFDNAWFGYLGYELKDSLESLTPSEPGNGIHAPALCMMRFGTIYRFDHRKKQLLVWCESGALPPFKAVHDSALYSPPPCTLRTAMSEREYLDNVADILHHIHAGDLYQANLTRKFIGRFAVQPAYFPLFRRMCHYTPGLYSAFLRMDDVYVLSSSPELFLDIDAAGFARAQPIKGTAARFADAAEDAESRKQLAGSAKDRAENLMIVDLLRNDLAKTARLCSVAVDNLFAVHSHATIHHLSSTITARKRTDVSTLDVVKHCFPPGSMTGAPKIAAMQRCAMLEKQQRGIYSGALGVFGGDGSCSLSVIIRALIMCGAAFEFQVGGGIVADSQVSLELKETFEKSKGLLQTLGLPSSYMMNL